MSRSANDIFTERISHLYWGQVVAMASKRALGALPSMANRKTLTRLTSDLEIER